ncbi:MAG TPA: 3-oxoadipyl-CoA thiolase [Humisphaera sp.]|nr:3-oxoadipyl-CoA thiolase [Humisphaera sp.]
MKDAFICDAIRTPIGRYGGALAGVRADDLAVLPIKALMERNKTVDWSALDDVIFGCANQAGEDNRNVARMAVLLAGLPESVSACTVNRLCGSGMEAVAGAARAIIAGEADLLIAGGVENMSRAPFVMGKAAEAYARNTEIYDTTMGWRFVNKRMKESFGTETMPETAENLAGRFSINRQDQDRFAFWSQQKTAAAQADGRMSQEIIPVTLPQRKGDPIIVAQDEHPRATSLEKLSQLKPIVRPQGTVTAGNASGINDGAAALLIASEAAVAKHGLTPRARILGAATIGVAPTIMGIGPVPATRKLLERLKLSLADMSIIELNEAFAAQALACSRELGLSDNDPRINPQGGAIALGHPLGMSGARLLTTATWQLSRTGGRRALCTMCIGVGQGIAVVLENCDQ